VTIHRSPVWPLDDRGAYPTPVDQVEVPIIMRALEPEVVDAVWAAVEALLPPR
jgi:hypothetical protein